MTKVCQDRNSSTAGHRRLEASLSYTVSSTLVIKGDPVSREQKGKKKKKFIYILQCSAAARWMLADKTRQGRLIAMLWAAICDMIMRANHYNLLDSRFLLSKIRSLSQTEPECPVSWEASSSLFSYSLSLAHNLRIYGPGCVIDYRTNAAGCSALHKRTLACVYWRT